MPPLLAWLQASSSLEHICTWAWAARRINPTCTVFVPSYGETDIFPGYFKYRGATITVSGPIQRNSGYPGIDVTDPAQIVAKTEGLTDHAYLARMKQKRGDLDGAIAEYNLAIEQDKQNSENYDKRASIKAEKGDAEGAIADYTRAIELGPNDTNAYSARAHLKLLTGDFNAALADYDKIVQIFPRWADAYNQRADIKKTKGDIAGANADYQMALQLDPANQTFRKNLQQAQASTSGKRAVPVANITPAFAQASPAATAAQSKPKSAEIIDVAPGYAEQGIKAGNIRVIFSDGHVAVQTYAGNCTEPHVSASGLVGWIRCKGFDRKNYALGEKIVVGPPNGLTKQFSPIRKCPSSFGGRLRIMIRRLSSSR